jgi:[ribosomal protein S5]-alanine N-acetyltransferase
MNQQIIFETERLLVRHYTPDDEENFFLLNGDEEVMRYIRPVKSREETNAFLAAVIDYSKKNPDKGRMAVIAKSNGEFVGSFAIIPVDGNEYMQLGYSLLPAHWGKGYATELTVAGLRFVFTQTDLDRIYGYTEKPNVPSQKVLLKAGFVQIGTRMEGEKELVEFLYEKMNYNSN